MKNVILYQDGSSDDYIALCFITAMLRKGHVNLSGVITAGTGEVDARCGLRNVAAICQTLNLRDLLLGQGEDKRIQAEHGQNFPAYIREFIDDLPTLIGLGQSTNTHRCANAVEAFHEIISKSEEPVLIISTGPLTDLARLFEQYPQDKKHIEIVMMGGAVHTLGNIQDLDPHIPNKLGEWNIFADTAAAKNVIASGVPLTMVPLDVTKHIQVTEQFYNELGDLAERNGKTAVSLAYNLIKALKIAFEKEHPEINFFDVYYLWDPFAAMVALEPQIAKIEEKYIKVDLQTGKTEEVSGSGEGIGHVRVAMDIAKPAPEILHHLLEAIASLTPPDMKHEAVTVPPFTLFGSNKGARLNLQIGISNRAFNAILQRYWGLNL